MHKFLDMHGIERAKRLARNLVERDGETQPIALTTDEALLLAQYIVQEFSPRPTESGEMRTLGRPLGMPVSSFNFALPPAAEEAAHALPYLRHVLPVAATDPQFIFETDPIYGGSWQRRGGSGAFMMLARKWDRLEERVKGAHGYDVFAAIRDDKRREGAIDDVRDLRRYLLLVEAWCVQRNYVALQVIGKDGTK